MRVLGDGSRSLGTWWLILAIGGAGASCDALLGLSDLSFEDSGGTNGDSSGGAGATNGGSGDTGGASSGQGGTSVGGNEGGAGDGTGGGDGAATNGGDSGARTGGAGGVSGGKGGAPGGKGGASNGGSAGSSAGSGSGGTSGTGGTGGGPNCRGHEGPTPVNIEQKFCIDRTEVTNAQYARFLASNPSAPTHPRCGWNFDYTPSDGWPAAVASLPVTYVDFCDAQGYCEWAGKRLCGAIVGGGAFDYNAWPTNRADTELYYACSNGDGLVGNSYIASACATDNQDSARIVGSSSGCEGGFPGLFDLSGNVAEWQDSCIVVTGGEGNIDPCRLGSYGFSRFDIGNPPGSDFSCRVSEGSQRGLAFDDYGIRCCSDAIP